MGGGEVAPDAMAAIASAALSPSGQPRTLNESCVKWQVLALGAESPALGRALDPMGGLGIMFDVMIIAGD